MKQDPHSYSRAADLFQQLTCDPSFYGPSREYDEAVARARVLSSDNSIGGSDKCDIELALLRFRRIRFISDTPELMRDLEAVRAEASSDARCYIKWRIAHAEIALYRRGDFIAAQRELELLEEELRPIYDEFLYALIANGLAVACTLSGDVHRAEDYCQDCLTVFRHSGNEILHANALNNLALLRKVTCDYEHAERLYKRALSVYDRYGMDSAQVLALNNIGVLKMKVGDWDGCEHYLNKAISLRMNSDSLGKSGHDSLWKEEVNLAHLKLLRRDFDTARSLTARYLTERACEASRKLTALALEFLGEICMEQGRLDEARTHLRICWRTDLS
jgi:tetratricopeptide (TPR) repeat protein